MGKFDAGQGNSRTHIANHPTMNRRVRHDNSALGHHRPEIPIAQSVGDVPADSQLDDLGIEPAPSVNRISDNWLGHFGVSWTPGLYDVAPSSSGAPGRRDYTISPVNATESSTLIH
jgi:hypothetical protein